MPIVIKEVIVKATVEKNPQWSEQLDEVVRVVKQQVLDEMEDELRLMYDSRRNSTDR
ncbi:MAG: hypothetical protein WCU80_00495 [Paludibacteraceae bacterium]|nr:hypothetical protein [Prevotellaceae bacterium]